MASDTLYINFEQCAKCENSSVTVKDIASIICTNSKLANKINSLTVYKFNDKSNKRIVISALKVIEIINKEAGELNIVPLGETDIIIKYEIQKKCPPSIDFIKVALICIIVFFGAAFTIMAFNNDVAVSDLFKSIYFKLTGKESDGFTMLEITYSIGMALGIIVFYNHFGSKKFSDDPTPVEVEMRMYENDINTTIIDGDNREEDVKG